MFIRTLKRTFPLFRSIVSRDKLRTLRDITGSPIVACKSALDETNQDVKKAKELLISRGLAYPKPKARRYKDGYISLYDGEEGVNVVQLSCETDFVARTSDFSDVLKILMRTLKTYPKVSIDNTEIEKFLEVKLGEEKKEKYTNKTIKEILALLSSNTLENCDINNLLKREVKPGIIIGSYLHGEIEGSSNEPRIGTRAGVAVCESQSKDIASVKKLANSIALQVTAMKPLYISKELMPQDVLESKGKDKGFLEEMVLMEQQYIEIDEKKTVREAIIQKQYELKAEVKVKEVFYYDCKL